ncbi:transglutaminase TgpA family protein [Aurantivibrio infirmus]
MTILYQIPRNSLVWLLLSQVLLIIPHIQRLPPWLIFAWMITVAWRIQIHRGLWSYPNRWVKIIIILICLVGLISEYGRLFGLEPMIGLLVTAFILKLLEMQRKRDALTLIYLGYFIAATQFLFSQTIFTTAYIFIVVIINTTALIGLYQSGGHKYPWRGLKLASTLILQSVPLMFVLFLVIPRFGSLWAVPQPTDTGQTGVSDSMSPGDFSRLTKSDAMAFRVKFKGQTPPNASLYWRGLVFSEFDGRSWSQGGFQGWRGGAPINWLQDEKAAWRSRIVPISEGVEYEVILEPTQQNWLYALASAESQNSFIGLTLDNRLVSRTPIRTRTQYTVNSFLRYEFEKDSLSVSRKLNALELPQGFNPVSIGRAKEMRMAVTSDRAFIEDVLNYFNQEFTYTLEPPLLGNHSVDEFLWETKKGFCEHFASSFVVMMRAAGIPARVVVGYQGGELNPIQDFLVVRQLDAHAWAEVWLEGEGWVRVDPTAAVAPERIESGLSALSSDEFGRFGGILSLNNYRHINLLNSLRLRLEVLEYNWHSLVMGYDQESQADVLRKLLGEITALRIAILLLGVGGLMLLVIGLIFFLNGGRAVVKVEDKIYRSFLKKLASKGIKRNIGEGPRAFAQRVSKEYPELSNQLGQVTRFYEAVSYQGDTKQVKMLKLAVKES